MHTVTRTHEIACGHRVYGHESKCKHLHGHNYVFELTCQGDLDSLGRVIDFGIIKVRLCQWLEDTWDHKLLLWEQDPIICALQAAQITFLAVPFNPTAECIAEHFAASVAPRLLAGTGVLLTRCTVWETGKCSATYEVAR